MPDSDEVDLGPGTLLISAPMMQDPNFRRSVVLLCEHNDREGTFGLILNRELDVSLGDVLDEYVTYDPPLYMGGPVQRETLHYLHTRADIPGGVALPGDMTWGGDFEAVQQLAKGGDAAPDNLRFFLYFHVFAMVKLCKGFRCVLNSCRDSLLFLIPTSDLVLEFFVVGYDKGATIGPFSRPEWDFLTIP